MTQKQRFTQKQKLVVLESAREIGAREAGKNFLLLPHGLDKAVLNCDRPFPMTLRSWSRGMT